MNFSNKGSIYSQLNPSIIINDDNDNKVTDVLVVVEVEQDAIEEQSTFLFFHQVNHPPRIDTPATQRSGTLHSARVWKAPNTPADAPTAASNKGKTQQEEASIAPNPAKAANPPNNFGAEVSSLDSVVIFLAAVTSFVEVIIHPILLRIDYTFFSSTNNFPTSIRRHLNISLGHRYRTMPCHTRNLNECSSCCMDISGPASNCCSSP